MGEFDRIKPPDERLRERPEGARIEPDEVDPQGRAALFSHGTPGGTPVGLAVHCSGCDATTALDVSTAIRSALPLFVVLPWRDHPVFAVCPACGSRRWLRIQPAQ